MTERESGGYYTSVVSGPGPAVREVLLNLAPAAGTASAAAEQTFTVPGLLAAERSVWVTQVSPSSVPVFTASLGAPGAPRTSAISVVSIPFINAGTSAGAITTGSSIGTQWSLGIAQARGA